MCANAKVLAEQRYPMPDRETLSVVVPRQLADADEGRLTVDFQTSGPLSPSAFGSPDRRMLAFGLTRIDVERSVLPP